MTNEKTIYQKLLAVQKEVGNIKKEETNPFFKSKYFDINGLLEVVKPVLSKNGLVLLQPIQTMVDTNVLSTTLIDVETGDKIESNVILPVNTDPQKMGAIITYFRRYSLQSLLALQAEDDDGNSISGSNADTKLGKCSLCGEQGQKSAKGYVFCPNWAMHKEKGEKATFVFEDKKLTSKEEEFVKSLGTNELRNQNK